MSWSNRSFSSRADTVAKVAGVVPTSTETTCGCCGCEASRLHGCALWRAGSTLTTAAVAVDD